MVEPLVSKQWFVTMAPLANKALQAVEDGDLRIIPDRFEKVHLLAQTPPPLLLVVITSGGY